MSLLFDKKADNENISACQSQPIQLQEIGIDPLKPVQDTLHQDDVGSRWQHLTLDLEHILTVGAGVGLRFFMGNEPQMTTDI